MPSKYPVELDGATLAQQLGARWNGAPPEVAWQAEVFPKRHAPVVVWSEGGRLLRSLQLGCFTRLAKSVKDPCFPNARSEDLMNRETFRGPFLHSRCLVPLIGFHEYSDFVDPPRWYGWLAPKDGRLDLAAGVWMVWAPAEGSPVEVFAIITRDAPDNAMKVGVTRVPIWLPAASCDRWLDPEQHNPRALQQILANYDPVELLVEQRTPPSRKKASTPPPPSSPQMSLF